MTEQTSENPNLETLGKIKIIFDAILKIVNRLAIIIIIVLLTFLTYFLLNKYFNISNFFTHIPDKVSKPVGLWTTVGLIFLIGLFLSVFRAKQQFWYGLFETAFALASCIFTVKSITLTSDTITVLIALGSTIYLIVRGLTNISDGVKKSFWLKKEILDISTNIKGVSNESITKALKDKEVLVDIVSSIANFISKLI